MLEVPFKLNEHGSFAQHKRVVSFSFPLPIGKIHSPESLQIYNGKEYVEGEFSTISSWPDSSAKWVRCNFIYEPKYSENPHYIIKNNSSKRSIELSDYLSCDEKKNQTTISTKHFSFELDNQLNINEIPWLIELIAEDETKYSPQVISVKPCDLETKLQKSFIYHGELKSPANKTALEFDCKLTFNAITPTIKIGFTLRNSLPMVHNDGKWDLGNDNSFYFNEFNIIFSGIDSLSSLLTITEANTANVNTINGEYRLFQASSGGENWNSSNHIDKDGKLNIAFKGYRTTQKGNKEVISGNRAEPLVTARRKDKLFAISSKKFWQNFPKSIASIDNKIVFGLFPKCENSLHELQPGEQKTHRFLVTITDSSANSLKNDEDDYSIKICPSYLAKTKVIPFFADSANDHFSQIILEGLTSENNFFQKRELIDEFGWRNFGDIFADHEILEYKGDKELISHYNNQYDALYGFIKQFLTTGNHRWWELAEDLAQHVKDIDIYHTDQDKLEYNHGLFWHTDHYLPAETASHRTYSKRQPSDAYQDHAGGGGPGGQHCYTTGLMLHYFLTNDETSKTTVVKLADWIANYYEGSNTLFEFLLGIKNQHVPGIKNKLTGQYPLDRGTGNYIVALLDAYEVTTHQSYLDKVSLIIKNTACPKEDLALRNLSNIEESWFYTIFLQAVTRYLCVKSTLMQLDESFYYARDLLLHFANWMIENEKPYLITPEQLEYPNHTWAAQDIRKANVLYFAFYFANHNDIKKQQYKTKADEFYQYVFDTLKDEKTRTYTRIQAILMQNFGVKGFVENNQQFSFCHQTASQSATNESVKQNKLVILKTLITTLMGTSLKKELRWLSFRSKKVNDLLGAFLK